jgi:hypothetical protein
LTIKEDKQNEKMTYVNSAMEKLKNLEKAYNSNYNIIRDKILSFMTAKNNCINDISEHFDKLIQIIETQKTSSIYMIEKFSKEKLGIYNDALQSLDRYRDSIQLKMEKLDNIKNQKLISKIPLADEISVLTSLGIDKIENKEFQREVEKLIQEMQGDYLPKIIIKNECM